MARSRKAARVSLRYSILLQITVVTVCTGCFLIRLKRAWMNAPAAARSPRRPPHAPSDMRAIRAATRPPRARRASVPPTRAAITGSCVPCAMKIGTSRLAALACASTPISADQVSRQRDDAGEPRVEAQAGVQRDRAALREAREQRAARRDAARSLARQQRVDMRLRAPHAVDIGALVQVRLPDVVPRAHPHAVVDRHGHHRRMRKDEADREFAAAIRAKARPPTSRCRRRRGRASR